MNYEIKVTRSILMRVAYLVAYLFTPSPHCTIINIFYKCLGLPHIHFGNDIRNKYLIAFHSSYSIHIIVISSPTKY